MENLELKDTFNDKLVVTEFLVDKKIVFAIETVLPPEDLDCINVYLNADQINQLITHLSEQLTKIGVQVDILKEK